MKIRVGHLYPDYLNIYADRGNIAVLARRGALARPRARGARRSGSATPSSPDEHDLLYVGGGQDREQALIAPDLAAKGAGAARGGRGRRRGARRLRRLPAARPLLPRPLRRASCPAPACFPLHTVAGERRMIGDVLLECELDPGERRTLAGLREPRRPHDPRRGRGAARPRGRGLRQRRRERLRGLPRRPRDRHVPARAAAAAQPVARRLAARAGGRAPHRRRAAGASSRWPTSSRREAQRVVGCPRRAAADGRSSRPDPRS